MFENIAGLVLCVAVFAAFAIVYTVSWLIRLGIRAYRMNNGAFFSFDMLILPLLGVGGSLVPSCYLFVGSVREQDWGALPFLAVLLCIDLWIMSEYDKYTKTGKILRDVQEGKICFMSAAPPLGTVKLTEATSQREEEIENASTSLERHERELARSLARKAQKNKISIEKKIAEIKGEEKQTAEVEQVNEEIGEGN